MKLFKSGRGGILLRLPNLLPSPLGYAPVLSVNKNYEQESNPMSWPLQLYLSRSAFLVSFTDPDKQLPNVKHVFKFLNDVPSVQEICRFITLLEIEVLFIKQCPLKFLSDNKC